MSAIGKRDCVLGGGEWIDGAGEHKGYCRVKRMKREDGEMHEPRTPPPSPNWDGPPTGLSPFHNPLSPLESPLGAEAEACDAESAALSIAEITYGPSLAPYHPPFFGKLPKGALVSFDLLGRPDSFRSVPGEGVVSEVSEDDNGPLYTVTYTQEAGPMQKGGKVEVPAWTGDVQPIPPKLNERVVALSLSKDSAEEMDHFPGVLLDPETGTVDYGPFIKQYRTEDYLLVPVQADCEAGLHRRAAPRPAALPASALSPPRSRSASIPRAPIAGAIRARRRLPTLARPCAQVPRTRYVRPGAAEPFARMLHGGHALCRSQGVAH